MILIRMKMEMSRTSNAKTVYYIHVMSYDCQTALAVKYLLPVILPFFDRWTVATCLHSLLQSRLRETIALSRMMDTESCR